MNLTFDLPLCQEHQNENRGSSVYILKTKTKEMMNEYKILGVIVVAASFLTVWGFNVNVCRGHF
jgi:hypothetical protein